MASEVEIERILELVTSALNDQQLEKFDVERVQAIASAELAIGMSIRVDDGGGLHDEAGLRIGAIRRTTAGEWIIERQNVSAERADTDIPVKADDD